MVADPIFRIVPRKTNAGAASGASLLFLVAMMRSFPCGLSNTASAAMPCAEKQSAGKRNEEEDHFERAIATVRGKPEKPFDEAHISISCSVESSSENACRFRSCCPRASEIARAAIAGCLLWRVTHFGFSLPSET